MLEALSRLSSRSMPLFVAFLLVAPLVLAGAADAKGAGVTTPSPGATYDGLWQGAATAVDDSDIIPEEPVHGLFLEQNVTMSMRNHGASMGRNLDALTGGGAVASTFRVAAPEAPSRLDVRVA